METSEAIVIEGQKVREGTSIFIESTDEVVWITDIRPDSVEIETVSGSAELRKERFVQRLQDAAIEIEDRTPRRERI